jgi:hypothetical protein
VYSVQNLLVKYSKEHEVARPQASDGTVARLLKQLLLWRVPPEEIKSKVMVETNLARNNKIGMLSATTVKWLDKCFGFTL